MGDIKINPKIAWGVNGESDAKGWKGGQKAIVNLTDKYGIKIYLKEDITDEHYFYDENDKKGSTWSSKFAKKPYNSALKEVGLSDTEVKDILTDLQSALEQKSSRYDLSRVIDVLKEKGLTLKQIKALKGLKGDDLIKALLKELGLDPEIYISTTARIEKDLKAHLGTKNKIIIKGKMDALKEAAAKEGTLALYTDTLKKARELLDSIEKSEKEAAAKEAAKKAKEEAEKMAKEARAAIEKAPLTEVEFNKHKAHLTLKEGEKLIKFHHKNTYYAIVEQNGKKWKFKFAINKKYYIENHDGKPLVRLDKSWARDPKFKTQIVELETKVPTKAPTNGIATYQTQDGLSITWHDKNKDGVLDKDERKGMEMVINGANGSPVKIKVTSALAELIDASMNASGKGDGKITKEEMDKAARTIQRYAGLMEKSLEDAAQVYAQSATFRNLKFGELEKAKASIADNLTGISKDNYEKLLKDKKYHADIIKAVGAYYNSKPDATAQNIAAFMLRCAMASMTGMYTTFGVAALENMDSYNPGKVSEENLVAWLEKGEVEKEEGAEGDESLAVSKTELQKTLQEIEAKKVDIGELTTYYKGLSKGLKLHPEVTKAMFRAYEGAHNKDDQALEMAMKMKEGKDEALNRMIKKYIDKQEFEKARKTAEALGASKDAALAQIAVECYKHEDKRELALEILKEVKGINPAYTPDNNSILAEFSKLGLSVKQNTDLDGLIRIIEDTLRTPAAVLSIKETVFKGDQTKLQNAGEAIKKLDELIKANSGDSVENLKVRAHALQVKAEILKAQADEEWAAGNKDGAKTPYKTAIDKYMEMAKAARESVYLFIALRNKAEKGSKDYTYHNEKYQQANGLIGTVIADKAKLWQPKSRTGIDPDPKKSYYEKEFKKIGEYIKAGTNLLVSDSQGPKSWLSSQFKKFYFRMSKDTETKEKPGIALENIPKKTAKLVKKVKVKKSEKKDKKKDDKKSEKKEEKKETWEINPAEVQTETKPS